MVDAIRTLRTGALLATCRLLILCRRGVARGATCRPAVNDGNRELVGAHVDDADRIAGNRAPRIGRVFQQSLGVVVGNNAGVLGRVGRATEATSCKAGS